ncbi:MotA/TolQ/ExbB proton channel family protein [Pelagicoccus sp. NFK12]|uniref:MotA/TolQ/ExbB proton channel family protein n=1 Tax=Pelagicoccus enzymogenes TaxID=2773457 RepID=A0A927FBF3_9BACT|nr:MotA/TolQ/ExbB proton channel family protein [Pelagicoccus enzymogenes]MBD5781300.1 MotA/TolQ/ExbB proton channel family protein [Pelagicoccus enzymogenes]MDQ8198798.1 MotA/TolQ/ExbB proton channel family protein [Pelagicoccus enzymogenes]
MTDFFQESFLPIWNAGGTLMYPLVGLALLIFFTGMEIVVYLNELRGKPASDRTIEDWVNTPSHAGGEIQSMIEYGKAALPDQRDVINRFSEMRNEHIARIDRRRTMLAVFVSAAPLTGLLGTVIGMLSTFKGLAISSGGQTVNMVADGISEALITTQLGLVIAIPGYILMMLIEKRQNALDTLITRIEATIARKARQANWEI